MSSCKNNNIRLTILKNVILKLALSYDKLHTNCLWSKFANLNFFMLRNFPVLQYQ